MKLVRTFITLLSYLILVEAKSLKSTETELKNYILNEYETKASEICKEDMWNSWNYETDINAANEAKFTESTLKYAKFQRDTYEEWFKDVDVETIKDPSIKRMMEDLKLPRESILNERDLKTLSDAVVHMTTAYSSAKICPFTKKGTCKASDLLNLDPDIYFIMSDEESEYETLEYTWKSWHDASGKKMREDYRVYVDLSNKMARLNDFTDYGAYWRHSFKTDSFEKNMEAIWNRIKPFYLKLHRYVSSKLKKKHGNALDISDGLLPAHILGDIIGLSWANLDTLVKPYINESQVDITDVLFDQGYTALKIFETANEFYMSLGLPSSNMSYGSRSMIERPRNREVSCHPTAWDFCDKKTFLIKMCTSVNGADFLSVHHEMGHILYYQLYRNQPIVFRNDANPAFHEAIGDTIALSVQSIQHMKKIHLISDSYKETKEAGINMLMNMALDKVAFLPFGLVVDKWRWDVFSGKIQVDQWNKHWWDLRKEYQLLKPPVKRSESDFDPGAVYHVAADSQYISYYISHILQFQLYRALCIEAGQYDPKTKSPPLHECDFYGRKAVGNLLKKGLSLGRSKPWPDVLEVMTGSRELDVNALLEYFSPLIQFLEVNV